MSISYIGASISASPTLRLNVIAAQMREKGDAVIHLGGGEPKSKAPIDAVLSAVGLIKTGEVRYTAPDGTPPLKQAVIRYTEEFYNRKVDPENVLCSSGAKQAIMSCLQATVNPMDEVIFPAPYWVSYPEMVKLVGGVPVPVYSEDGSFFPRLQDIEMKCGPNTKTVIINSPNNPSGVMYPREFIADIVQFCEKRGYYLIMDDIYHRLIFDGKKPANPYEFASDPDGNSKLVVVNGVSKTYAMTGFRIGWAIASKRLVEVMANIQGHQTSGPSAVCQAAAVGALTGVQSSVESLRITLENNRNVMVDRLRSFSGVNICKPDGTFYCFADFRAYEKDSTKLAEQLLKKVMVVTVPGCEFGMEGFLRLSYCGTVKDVTEGIERMKWALDPNAPNELYVGTRKLVRELV